MAASDPKKDPGFPSHPAGGFGSLDLWYLKILGKRNPLGIDDAFPILSFDGHIWSYVQTHGPLPLPFGRRK